VSNAPAVLDASALLALLQAEPGASRIEPLLDGAFVSAVNWSEVLQKSLARAVDVSGMAEDLVALGVQIRPFDADDARSAAEIWARAPRAGLAMGDRACLALAERSGRTAVTTDRTWDRLKIGVQVLVVR
jgi:PIN domain nuclease of toxin-antitoxin system